MRLWGENLHARLLCSAAVLSLVAATAPAHAQQAAVDFNIPPQSLQAALDDFASQSRHAILSTPDMTAAKVTPGVTGTVKADDALGRLLAGTGLTYRLVGETFLIVQAGEGGSPQGGSAAGGGAEVETLIVTAQKKEEAIQDVPIAISAFTQKSLDAQKIEGGFDLLKAIPNVTFSKSNFSGYNFSIRGIGTQAVSATTDPGVAVAFNNTTLIVNRLFEQEYVDVERVEVLRGPQGTLYGRNATAGVINVISAKPRLGEFFGELKLEGGNYNAQRVRGHVNVPIGETLALRGAFAMTKRDGYGVNLAASDPDANTNASEDVDGRDLWTGRLTLGWEPMEALRVNLMWEHFEEDDNRVRTSKQLCHRDTGPEGLTYSSGVVLDAAADFASGQHSQGCKGGSLYEDGAFQTPNGPSLPYVAALYWAPLFGGDFVTGGPAAALGGNPWHTSQWPGGVRPADLPCDAAAFGKFLLPVDRCNPDIYGGQTQSRDLREIYSLIEPSYQAKSDVFDLSFDIDLTENLTLSSQTVYARDEYFATQDYNRFASLPIWTDSTIACGVIGFTYMASVDCSNNPTTGVGTYAGGFYAGLAPGGVITDPQLGSSNTLIVQDLSRAKSSQYNQEFRLASNFDAPFNFSAGVNFTKFDTYNDYFVFSNGFTYLLNFFPFNYHAPNSPCFTEGKFCRYVDDSPGGIAGINGEGHNYFRSANPYRLTSSAIFGELYWNVTETIKVTAGGRFTWDRKVFTPVPSELFLADYREAYDYSSFGTPEPAVRPGGGPEECRDLVNCNLAGMAPGGRGQVAEPDIVQEWREPTGRLVVDWKPDLGFTDETMLYASIARGYKGGGANPPSVAQPSKTVFDLASRGTPDTFDAEYVNAFEIGSKNTLAGGALVLNGGAFYYDYTDYQVSKIIDRRAVNENFDAEVWGVELEWVYSLTRNLRFNGAFGHMGSRIGDGEQSIDLMDRTAGGQEHFANPDGSFPEGFDDWVVIKPWIVAASNCVVPRALIEANLEGGANNSHYYCPSGTVATGNIAGENYTLSRVAYIDENGNLVPSSTSTRSWTPSRDAPNGGAGFFKDISGNDLPSAPHWTASIGGQYTAALPGGWDATVRADFYWQSQSFHRVYNSQYDKLRAWTNTNVSLWVENPDWGVTAEVYVKNVFDETPITGAFLNSDDSGLTTNVFTLDPRLVGVSVRKSF